MPRLVQLVLTDDQAELTAAALRDASNSEDVTADEASILYDLGYYFQTASESPARFPLTGKMATSLPRKLRGELLKPGSGNTANSTRNERKARQERRAGWAKTRRKNRSKMAADYNLAVATMEAEQIEADQIIAEQEAALAKEPKRDIYALDGKILLAGVPLSMIRQAREPVVRPEVLRP